MAICSSGVTASRSQDGWIEQLSRKLGCRVANYGVTGYGTDQAYIRFTRMTQDEAPVVLLGIFPENVMRNVNQYRGFLGFTQRPHWLKGRFVLDGAGKLEWIHARASTRPATCACCAIPPAWCRTIIMLPDSRDGPVTLRFPYTLALARVALHAAPARTHHRPPVLGQISTAPIIPPARWR